MKTAPVMKKSGAKRPRTSQPVCLNLQQPPFNVSKFSFQASGKNVITFVAGKKVYGNGILSKKVRIDANSYEVQISEDQTICRGIRAKSVSRSISGLYQVLRRTGQG